MIYRKIPFTLKKGSAKIREIEQACYPYFDVVKYSFEIYQIEK
jgi:hypothetical protein